MSVQISFLVFSFFIILCGRILKYQYWIKTITLCFFPHMAEFVYHFSVCCPTCPNPCAVHFTVRDCQETGASLFDDSKIWRYNDYFFNLLSFIFCSKFRDDFTQWFWVSSTQLYLQSWREFVVWVLFLSLVWSFVIHHNYIHYYIKLSILL